MGITNYSYAINTSNEQRTILSCRVNLAVALIENNWNQIIEELQEWHRFGEEMKNATAGVLYGAQGD